jgi:hypothetical protein
MFEKGCEARARERHRAAAKARRRRRPVAAPFITAAVFRPEG